MTDSQTTRSRVQASPVHEGMDDQRRAALIEDLLHWPVAGVFNDATVTGLSVYWLKHLEDTLQGKGRNFDGRWFQFYGDT